MQIVLTAVINKTLVMSSKSCCKI